MSMTLIDIENALKQLRLSGMRATLETRVLEAQAANLPFLEVFSTILQDELDCRQSRLLERRYKHSGLDERTALDEFDWGYNPKIPKRTCFELNTLKFIREGDNAILIGPPGTGKSHVAKAVAYTAIRSGFKVVYAEADELLSSLMLAAPPRRQQRYRPMIEADLLVLDDLFMARKMVQESADQLQALVHKRYRLRRSVLITSNRVIADWAGYLGDTALATTILDRLMHRSVLAEFEGRSYRLKEAAGRLATDRQTD